MHVLGSGSGFPTAARDTSSLLVGVAGDWSLVDCPGAVVHKLARCGILPAQLTRVILTHNHIDHVYGFPHLMQAMAIEGIRRELEVLAPQQALDTVDAMIAAHGLEEERYPRLRPQMVDVEAPREIVARADLRIVSAPAAHGRDTVALRFSAAGGSVCYSSDTRPCVAVEELARGAALLFHDCAGPHRQRGGFADSHSSALEAAEVATRAGVGELILMHLAPRGAELLQECLLEACSVFPGPVSLAEDGGMREVW